MHGCGRCFTPLTMCKAKVTVVNHSLTLTKGKNESMTTTILLTEGQETYREDIHGDRQIKANPQPSMWQKDKTMVMNKAQKGGSDG